MKTFEDYLAKKMTKSSFAEKFNKEYERIEAEYYDNLSSNSTLNDSADYTDTSTNTSANKTGGRKLLILE